MDQNLLLFVSLNANIFLFLLLTVYIISGSILKRKRRLPTIDEQQEIIEKTQDKSVDILSKATQKANSILSNAELRGIKLFSQEKMESEKFTEEYKKHIHELEDLLKTRFTTQAEEADRSYSEFIKNMETTIQFYINRNQKLLEEKSNTMIADSQKLLTNFVTDLHQRFRSQVDLELAKAKSEIESYKQRRLSILDENIVEIIEKTVQIALGKKLTLTEHSDLIYKALEQAKKEHAFG